MHALYDVDARAAIRLRADRYALMWAVLGCTTDEAIATASGVNPRTIRRARNEGIVGEVFMAQTVHALRRHADKLTKYGLTPVLDELFSVVELPPASSAEAA